MKNCLASKLLPAVLVLLLAFKTNLGAVRGPWGPWTECSAPCNGNHARTRTCLASPGDDCAALSTETQRCNTNQCISNEALAAIIAFAVFILAAVILLIYVILKRRRRASAAALGTQANRTTSPADLARDVSAVEENYYDYGFTKRNDDNDYPPPSHSLYKGFHDSNEYLNTSNTRKNEIYQVEETRKIRTEPGSHSQPDKQAGAYRPEPDTHVPPYRPDSNIKPYQESGQLGHDLAEPDKKCGPHLSSTDREVSLERPDTNVKPYQESGQFGHDLAEPDKKSGQHMSSMYREVSLERPESNTKPCQQGPYKQSGPSQQEPDKHGQHHRRDSNTKPYQEALDKQSGPSQQEPDTYGQPHRPDSNTQPYQERPYKQSGPYHQEPDNHGQPHRPDINTEPSQEEPSHPEPGTISGPAKPGKSEFGIYSRFIFPKFNSFTRSKKSRPDNPPGKKISSKKALQSERNGPTKSKSDNHIRRPISSEYGNHVGTYLPDLDQEGQKAQREVDKMYRDGDSLDKISLTESIREATMRFDTEPPETERSEESYGAMMVGKIPFATAADKQTEGIDTGHTGDTSSWIDAKQLDSYLY